MAKSDQSTSNVQPVACVIRKVAGVAVPFPRTRDVTAFIPAAQEWARKFGWGGTAEGDTLAIIAAHVIGGFGMAELGLLMEPVALRAAWVFTENEDNGGQSLSADAAGGFFAGAYDTWANREQANPNQIPGGGFDWSHGYWRGVEFAASIPIGNAGCGKVTGRAVA